MSHSPRPTVLAAIATLIAYVAVAGLVSTIDIPADVTTAQLPWLRPFRVLATLGFGIASMLHLPHVAAQLIAAIVLGAVLGACFATARHWLQ